MAIIETLREFPDQLLDAVLAGENEPELYSVTFLSYVYPDPRDLTERAAIQVTVLVWARQTEHAAALVRAYPQNVTVGQHEQELPIVAIMDIQRRKINKAMMLDMTSSTGSEKKEN